MASTKAYQLFQVRKTLIEMMIDRGYVVLPELKNENFEDFMKKGNSNTSKSTEKLPFLFSKPENVEKLYVFFPCEPRVGLQTINRYLEKMREQQVYQAIIIYKTQLTSSAKTVTFFKLSSFVIT